LSTGSTQLDTYIDKLRYWSDKIKDITASGGAARNAKDYFNKTLNAAKMIAKDQGIDIDWSQYTYYDIPDKVAKVLDDLLTFADLKLMPFADAEEYLYNVLQAGRITRDTFNALRDALIEFSDTQNKIKDALDNATQKIKDGSDDLKDAAGDLLAIQDQIKGLEDLFNYLKSKSDIITDVSKDTEEQLKKTIDDLKKLAEELKAQQGGFWEGLLNPFKGIGGSIKIIVIGGIVIAGLLTVKEFKD